MHSLGSKTEVSSNQATGEFAILFFVTHEEQPVSRLFSISSCDYLFAASPNLPRSRVLSTQRETETPNNTHQNRRHPQCATACLSSTSGCLAVSLLAFSRDSRSEALNPEGCARSLSHPCPPVGRMSDCRATNRAIGQMALSLRLACKPDNAGWADAAGPALAPY